MKKKPRAAKADNLMVSARKFDSEREEIVIEIVRDPSYVIGQTLTAREARRIAAKLIEFAEWEEENWK
jgi:hypothetical protein